MTLYLLKVHLQMFLSVPITQKCQILSCDTLVANERCVDDDDDDSKSSIGLRMLQIRGLPEGGRFTEHLIVLVWLARQFLHAMIQTKNFWHCAGCIAEISLNALELWIKFQIVCVNCKQVCKV
jgi:hypothetical protein